MTHDFLGGGTYGAWYSRLHVTAPSRVVGGARRGPFDVIINVTPQE